MLTKEISIKVLPWEFLLLLCSYLALALAHLKLFKIIIKTISSIIFLALNLNMFGVSINFFLHIVSYNQTISARCLSKTTVYKHGNCHRIFPLVRICSISFSWLCHDSCSYWILHYFLSVTTRPLAQIYIWLAFPPNTFVCCLSFPL